MKRNFLMHYVALAIIVLGLASCGNVSLGDLENLGKAAEGLMQPKDQWHSLVKETKPMPKWLATR